MYRRLGLPDASAIVDVRTDEDHADDPRRLPGPVRRARRTIPAWARPGLALGPWLASQAHGTQLMATGDLALLAREVAPVMRASAIGGIEVTALFSHVLRAAVARTDSRPAG